MDQWCVVYVVVVYTVSYDVYEYCARTDGFFLTKSCCCCGGGGGSTLWTLLSHTHTHTDRWRSTLHRVVVKGHGARRQSIAYFCNMNADCVVDPKDLDPEQSSHYPPITAKEHLMSKHLASMGET